MSEEELREKIRIIKEATAENERIIELNNEKTCLGLQVALEYTRTLQETMELEEEVAEARHQLEKARKPRIKVTI